MADTILATPGTGATLASFDDGTGVEWVGSTIGYITGGSAGDWDIQVVDSTHGLPVGIVGTVTVATHAVTQSGTWTVTGSGGTFPVTDSGGSLTVDAPVGTPVFVRLSDGTSAISTLPVSLASVPSHAVTNAGTFVVQVDGTALTRLTDIETNTDSLAVVGNGAAATAQRVTLANDSTGIVALTTSTASIGKLAANSGVDIGDVDVTSIAAGDNNIGNVDIVTVPSDPFGANADAASATGSISAKLRFIASTGIPITGTVTVGSHAVTNAGTFAVQVDGAALTALQLIDDPVVTLGTTTYTEATSKGFSIGAVRRDADTTLVDTTNEFGPLQMDANGRLKVEAFSGETLPVSLTSTTVTGTVAVTQSGTWDEVGINDSGNSITVDNGGTFAVQVDGSALTALQLIDDGVFTDDTSTHSTGSSKGYGIMAVATPSDGSVNANDFGHVAMTTDRKMHVAVMDALPAGTNAIGKLAANSGVDIGDVDVTTLPAITIAAAQTLATVTTVSTVTTCSTVTTVSTLTGGGVAHDGADSGNPVKVGARAAATLSDDTMVANADRTDLVSDLDGALLAREGFPLGDLISERVSNTDGNSTAFSNFGAVASTRSYITAIVVYNSSATAGYIDFRDGTAGSVLYTVPIPATGGAVIAMGGSPLFRTSANTALAYDVSAALSTVYISVTGFKSKV